MLCLRRRLDRHVRFDLLPRFKLGLLLHEHPNLTAIGVLNFVRLRVQRRDSFTPRIVIELARDRVRLIRCFVETVEGVRRSVLMELCLRDGLRNPLPPTTSLRVDGSVFDLLFDGGEFLLSFCLRPCLVLAMRVEDLTRDVPTLWLRRLQDLSRITWGSRQLRFPSCIYLPLLKVEERAHWIEAIPVVIVNFLVERRSMERIGDGRIVEGKPGLLVDVIRHAVPACL